MNGKEYKIHIIRKNKNGYKYNKIIKYNIHNGTLNRKNIINYKGIKKRE